MSSRPTFIEHVKPKHARTASLPVQPLVKEGGGLKDLLGAINDGRPELSQALLTSGALLFRGFDVEGIDAFQQVVAAFSGKDAFLNYSGGASPRNELGSGERAVYSSTEYPPHISLPLHNELSYVGRYPNTVFFFCVVPPQTGGETTLGDSRRILRNMPPTIVQRLKRKKIRYIRKLSADKGSGYSWQDVFQTDDAGLVEHRCREIGDCFEWDAGGRLVISQVRPATARHPMTGEEVWFNQVDGFHPSALDEETYRELMAACGCEDNFRLNVSFADGSPIRASDIQEIRAVIRSETIPHSWRRGDILILDNLLAAHGRAPFQGPRKIAVAMT